jgi:cytoskeletal protein RodZ
VFEIGNSLREARLRQGIEITRAEADTKVRAKYLRALEEERFEVLPAETYVKGFLRTYAEYLGLDGQLYVDEFNSRFAKDEEVLLPATSTSRPRPRAVESNLVVVALAGIVAVTVLVVVAWQVGTGRQTRTEPLVGAGGTPTQTVGEPPAESTPTNTVNTPPSNTKPRLAKLALTAGRGDCWIQVRAGSASGELLYEGTVQQGQTQRFLKWKRLWMQLGAPSNLDVRLNGRRVRDFPAGQSVVVVTASGVRTVSTI